MYVRNILCYSSNGVPTRKQLIQQVTLRELRLHYVPDETQFL